MHAASYCYSSSHGEIDLKLNSAHTHNRTLTLRKRVIPPYTSASFTVFFVINLVLQQTPVPLHFSPSNRRMLNVPAMCKSRETMQLKYEHGNNCLNIQMSFRAIQFNKMFHFYSEQQLFLLEHISLSLCRRNFSSSLVHTLFLHSVANLKTVPIEMECQC